MRVDPTGIDGPTRAQARSKGWRRTSYGFFVPTDAPSQLPEQRALEQSVRLPPQGAVTGWAACRWWGAAFFDGLEPDGSTSIPVPLAVGPSGRTRRDRQVSVSYESLDPSEVVRTPWLPLTTRERAAFDEMRRTGDLREAVVAIEMLAAARVTSPRRMTAHCEGMSGVRRVELARTALRLAGPHSRSPNETRLKLIWMIDAGLPTPLVNCPVHDLSGRLLGIVDLLDPEAGLVVEFDGADHRSARRHSDDVDREAGLRHVGLEVARVTGPDLRDRAPVVTRLLAA